MGLILHTGVPGSGKSYYVVYQLLRSKVGEKYLIFHNIDGLKADLFPCCEYLRDWRELFGEEQAREHLTREYWESIVQRARDDWGRPVLLILDECQNILGEKNADILRFLSWHRHQGMDIWLICQHKTMIAREFRNLCEYEITGNKGHVIDHFLYTFKQERAVFKTIRLKKDIAVFAAYTSFQITGAKKATSKLIWYGLGALVGAGLFIVWGIYTVPKVFAKTPMSIQGGNSKSGEVKKELQKQGQVVKGQEREKRKQKDLCEPITGLSVAVATEKRFVFQDNRGHLLELEQVLPGAVYVRPGERTGEYLLLMEGAVCIARRQLLGVQYEAQRGAGLVPGGHAATSYENEDESKLSRSE